MCCYSHPTLHPPTQEPAEGEKRMRFMEKPQQANCFNQVIQITVSLIIGLIN